MLMHVSLLLRVLYTHLGSQECWDVTYVIVGILEVLRCLSRALRTSEPYCTDVYDGELRVAFFDGFDHGVHILSQGLAECCTAFGWNHMLLLLKADCNK